MPQITEPQYTEEELKEKYYKLPPDLREAISSPESSEAIYNIAKENGILNGAVEMSWLIGEVLLGILPPENFQEALEKKLGFEKEIAKKVSREIERQIFSRVSQSLTRLYGKPAKEELEERLKKIEEKVMEIAEKPQTRVLPGKDVYREEISEEEIR